MLSFLYIENVAVIEKSEINFQNGFNILTGETGAGKSIVIDAINAILGNRTQKELIRTGADCAIVSAVFSNIGSSALKALTDNDLSLDDDGNIIISREIRLDGRNICKICGKPVSLSTVREIAPFLISIQGQHESYELLSQNKHISYIDAYGSLDTALSEYQKVFGELKIIGKELDSVETDEEEKARRVDILRFQINELEAANIKIGEKEELTKRRNTINNLESIAEALNEAEERLSSGDSPAIENISITADVLEKETKILPDFEGIANSLRDIEYSLRDCISSINELSQNLDFDKGELENIEERLDIIYRLSHKYGSSEEEIIEFLENSKNELQKIEHSDERRNELSKKYEASKNKAVELAKRLSSLRHEISLKFEKSVMEELKFLDMPNVLFKVQMNRCPLNTYGCDDIAFMISVNPGEALKPISKVASGGELSRIMLAIRTTLSGKGDADTLIFDEVDSGISGSAAQKVGKKLKETSKSAQVICVTHLAQIAALANSQFLIEKKFINNRTYTDVKLLSFEERKYELSRMIGGNDITEIMLKNSEEMLLKGSMI